MYPQFATCFRCHGPVGRFNDGDQRYYATARSVWLGEINVHGLKMPVVAHATCLPDEWIRSVSTNRDLLLLNENPPTRERYPRAGDPV